MAQPMSSLPPSLLDAVTVVVPCKDSGKTIDEQLQALAGQDYTGPLEVIVVDNGSVDESAYLAGRWPNVKVVTALDRQSPNHARNVGANAASGDLILTCDADDVVAAHWVSAMAEGLKKFDLVGGPLDFALLNADTQRWPQRDHGLPLRYTFLPAATGANFGIRSSVLADLGGWDESFDGGPDDTELCWRAQLAGYDLGFAPGGLVHYRLRSTTSDLAKQAYSGGRKIPQLARRFRGEGMPYRGLLGRAFRFGGYIVFAAPLALFSRRIRMEWIRRVALAAGFSRGLLESGDDPIVGPVP